MVVARSQNPAVGCHPAFMAVGHPRSIQCGCNHIPATIQLIAALADNSKKKKYRKKNTLRFSHRMRTMRTCLCCAVTGRGTMRLPLQLFGMVDGTRNPISLLTLDCVTIMAICKCNKIPMNGKKHGPGWFFNRGRHGI